MKSKLTTRHSDIFKYWKNKMITPSGDIVNDDNSYENGIPVIKDYGEPCCWACGRLIEDIFNLKDYHELLNENIDKLYDNSCVKSVLNRCHIIPNQAGGADEPSNLFLLCESCHIESPDTKNPRNFFRWVYKKRNGGLFVKGFNITKIFANFISECKARNKNPRTADFDSMQVFQHGSHISESTIYMAMVDTCEDL